MLLAVGTADGCSLSRSGQQRLVRKADEASMELARVGRACASAACRSDVDLLLAVPLTRNSLLIRMKPPATGWREEWVAVDKPTLSKVPLLWSAFPGSPAITIMKIPATFPFAADISHDDEAVSLPSPLCPRSQFPPFP